MRLLFFVRGFFNLLALNLLDFDSENVNNVIICQKLKFKVDHLERNELYYRTGRAY